MRNGIAIIKAALYIFSLVNICNIFRSVADPDPPAPHVFGPPGSGSTSERYGSGSFYHHEKIVRKNLDSFYFVTLFDYFSLKNDVNVLYLQKVTSGKFF